MVRARDMTEGGIAPPSVGVLDTFVRIFRGSPAGTHLNRPA